MSLKFSSIQVRLTCLNDGPPRSPFFAFMSGRRAAAPSASGPVRVARAAQSSILQWFAPEASCPVDATALDADNTFTNAMVLWDGDEQASVALPVSHPPAGLPVAYAFEPSPTQLASYGGWAARWSDEPSVLAAPAPAAALPAVSPALLDVAAGRACTRKRARAATPFRTRRASTPAPADTCEHPAPPVVAIRISLLPRCDVLSTALKQCSITAAEADSMGLMCLRHASAITSDDPRLQRLASIASALLIGSAVGVDAKQSRSHNVVAVALGFVSPPAPLLSTAIVPAPSRIATRARRSTVLGPVIPPSPTGRDGMLLNIDKERALHERHACALLRLVPDRYAAGAFSRCSAMQDEAVAEQLPPLAVRSQILARVLWEKRGSIRRALTALFNYIQWSKQLGFGDGMPASPARIAWHLEDVRSTAVHWADELRKSAIARGAAPSSFSGQHAAANRRAGLQFCELYLGLPLYATDKFTRAAAAASGCAPPRSSALLVPPVALFQLEWLSRRGTSTFIRVSAAVRFVGIVSACRAIDVWRSSPPLPGAVADGVLELHGVSRCSKTSKGSSDPWWAGIVPLSEPDGLNVEEWLSAIPPGADFMLPSILGPDGLPCKRIQDATGWAQYGADQLEYTAGMRELLSMQPCPLPPDVIDQIDDHSGRHTLIEVGRAMFLKREARRELGRWRASAEQRKLRQVSEQAYSRRVGAPAARFQASATVLRHLRAVATSHGGWHRLPRDHSVRVYACSGLQYEPSSDEESDASDSD